MKIIKWVELILITIIMMLLIIHTLIWENKIIWKGSEEENKVWLTFDDGPRMPETEQILDILKEKNASAIFFVVGENAEKYPELIKRIVKEGHQIGIHSYKHELMVFKTNKEILYEVEITNNIIKNITGHRTNLFRAPWGLLKPSVIRELRGEGYKIIHFNLISYDYKETDYKEIVKNVLRNVEGGDIVLMHDGGGLTRNATVKALPYIIIGIKEKNLNIVNINKLN